MTRRLLAFLCLCLFSASTAYAQASIGGVVRDPSGAILPGVSVEAASPALIERVRSVVTDGNGQYKIVDLRPGTYSVTFTLPGFSTVRRDGVELAGSFAATINAELTVGAVNETITVTGESPVVDVQNSKQQQVMGSEVLNAIPTGRTQFGNAVLVPGINTTAQDVGGANNLAAAASSLTIHGSRAGDQRVQIGGVPTANLEVSGNSSNFIPNMGSVQELTVDVAAGTADQETGGVKMNLIPREGGNSVTGSFFGTAANGSFQANNFSDDLRARGLRTPDAIKLNYDFNPALGGPIVADRVWFFSSARFTMNKNYVGGVFANLNAGKPDQWLYVADTSTRGVYTLSQESVNGRVTWQANPTNKVSVYYDHQWRCWCTRTNVNVSPESASTYHFPGLSMLAVTWTSPITNKLLVEASAVRRGERFIVIKPPVGDVYRTLIPVVEQSSGLVYRGIITNNAANGQPFIDDRTSPSSVLGSLTYVTGAHAFKVGAVDSFGTRDASYGSPGDVGLMYRFNNGVPNQLTQYATPYGTKARLGANIGFFAQDKWTYSRLTMNLGVRFDYLSINFPETTVGPAPLVPNRNATFPKQDWVSWKDVSPRVGINYDLFGNGKTAIKGTINKYMVAQGVQGNGSDPVSLLANMVTRSWADANRNFSPDCDLTNVLANGECGILSNTLFGGTTRTTTYDPKTLKGWGVRPNNWEFSASVQQELMPRVSASVGYFRRWYGNFAVTDNQAVAATDYNTYSITAPADARLPGGGGYTISGLYDLNPAKAGQVNNYFTFASNYGEQTEFWHGMDATVNMRLQRNVLLQGGVSTGKSATDVCDIVTKNFGKVNVSNTIGNAQSTAFCHQETLWLTQVKFLGVYTVPRIEVQVSGTFQSLPGPQLSANYAAPNAVITPSLGRPLSGGAANATINLLSPGSLYGERLNQLDVRVGKLLRFGGLRTSLNLDIFNALNVNTVLTENAAFASWRVPQTILQARFVKISAQLDF